MRSVVVTGGAGFIGSHVVEQLVAMGCRVLVIDDLSTGRADNVSRAPGVRLLRADVNDVEPAAIEDADAIVHLAAVASVQQSWTEPALVQRRNLGSTLQVIEWARSRPGMRIVFASSAAVYGDPRELPVSEAATSAPLSPYGLHKLASEIYLRLFAATCGFTAVGLRLFNVYGPRQSERSDYAGVISRFARTLLEGGPIELHGGGEQTRDFVHASDVATAVVEALRLPLGAGEWRCFNIGTQRAVSVAELLQALERVSGIRARTRVGSRRAGDIAHSLADIGAARATLGYAPTVTLDDGLAGYLAWLRLPESA